MAWASKNTAQAALKMTMDHEAVLGDPAGAQPVLYTPSSLDRLLEAVGDEGVIKALTARSDWERDKAANLGTSVHNLADLVVQGKPLPEMTETEHGRVVHYADWWLKSGWSLRTSEALLVNTAMGYGGTLDLLCRDRDGKTVLADIKTGRLVHHEAVLQLTAYGAAEILEDQAGNVFRMPPVDRYAILHVTASEVREVPVDVGSLELAAWQAAMKLTEWRDSMKGKRL